MLGCDTTSPSGRITMIVTSVTVLSRFIVMLLVWFKPGYTQSITSKALRFWGHKIKKEKYKDTECEIIWSYYCLIKVFSNFCAEGKKHFRKACLLVLIAYLSLWNSSVSSSYEKPVEMCKMATCNLFNIIPALLPHPIPTPSFLSMNHIKGSQ